MLDDVCIKNPFSSETYRNQAVDPAWNVQLISSTTLIYHCIRHGHIYIIIYLAQDKGLYTSNVEATSVCQTWNSCQGLAGWSCGEGGCIAHVWTLSIPWYTDNIGPLTSFCIFWWCLTALDTFPQSNQPTLAVLLWLLRLDFLDHLQPDNGTTFVTKVTQW